MFAIVRRRLAVGGFAVVNVEFAGRRAVNAVLDGLDGIAMSWDVPVIVPEDHFAPAPGPVAAPARQALKRLQLLSEALSLP